MFKQSVIEALGFYVYALVDPRDRRIFYIGKGENNRVFDHARDALCGEDAASLKLSTIRDILAEGEQVEYYILRHNLTEDEALLVESALIDMLTYEAFNTERVLTNLVAGHHQWNEGIKTAEEINIMYDCAKIEPAPADRMLLVSMNRSYKKGSKGIYDRENDYEAARKHWKIADWRAPRITHILGVYRGIVRIVIRVTGFEKIQEGPIAGRYIFEGEILNDSPYLNTDASDYPFGSGGAVTYIPRDWHAFAKP